MRARPGVGTHRRVGHVPASLKSPCEECSGTDATGAWSNRNSSGDTVISAGRCDHDYRLRIVIVPGIKPERNRRGARLSDHQSSSGRVAPQPGPACVEQPGRTHAVPLLRPTVQWPERVHGADELMAQITAERLVEHLERARYVVMCKPPADQHGKPGNHAGCSQGAGHTATARRAAWRHCSEER